MDLSNLNFKQALVVLTKPTMRMEILNFLKDEDIDMGIKFVDSYIEGAKQVQKLKFDPYDYIVVDKTVNNSKSKDFIEYITLENKNSKLLTFSSSQKIELF